MAHSNSIAGDDNLLFEGGDFAPPFGTGVWSASYGELVPLGIYEPPWKYPPEELALDLSYHLAYGLAVAVTYAALDR